MQLYVIVMLECHFYKYYLCSLRTYRADGNEASRPFTQQLLQLLFGDGVHNETEDEEGRKDKAQSSTQERVKTHAFVVTHISPACTQRKSAFNVKFSAAGNICLCCTHMIWFIGSKMPRVILHNEHMLACPSLVCC